MSSPFTSDELARNIAGAHDSSGVMQICSHIIEEFELRIPVSTADMNRLLAHEAGTQAYLLQGPVSSTHVDILPRMTADRAAYQGLQPDARNIAVTACAPCQTRSGLRYGVLANNGSTTTVTEADAETGETKTVSVTRPTATANTVTVDFTNMSFDTTPRPATAEVPQSKNIFVLAIAIARYWNSAAADTITADQAIFFIQWFIGENANMNVLLGGDERTPTISNAPKLLASKFLRSLPQSSTDAIIIDKTLANNGFRILKFLRDKEKGDAKSQLDRSLRAVVELGSNVKTAGDTPASIVQNAVTLYQRYVAAKRASGSPVDDHDPVQGLAFQSVLLSFRDAGRNNNNPAFGILLAAEHNAQLHQRATNPLYKLQSIVARAGSKDTTFAVKKKKKPKKTKQAPKQQEGEQKTKSNNKTDNDARKTQNNRINEMNRLFHDYFLEGLDAASMDLTITQDDVLAAYENAINESGFSDYTYQTGTKAGQSMAKPLDEMMANSLWFFTYVPEKYRDEIMNLMEIDVDPPDGTRLREYRDRSKQSKSFAATRGTTTGRGRGRGRGRNSPSTRWSRNGSDDAEDALRQLALERSYADMQNATADLRQQQSLLQNEASSRARTTDVEIRMLQDCQNALASENEDLRQRIALLTSAAEAPAQETKNAKNDAILEQLRSNARQALQLFREQPGDLNANVLAVHAENLLENDPAHPTVPEKSDK